MIKKDQFVGLFKKKKNIRNNIYLGNKKNSKATIDQKKEKKEIVKERKNNH
jgi:hypothetical protein